MWYTRGERARDREVPHPQRGVLYKSGVHARSVLCFTLGDLPAVRRSGLRTGRPKKSAEVRVGGDNEPGPAVRSIPEDSPHRRPKRFPLIRRIAAYVIRMYGGVGGEERP